MGPGSSPLGTGCGASPEGGPCWHSLVPFLLSLDFILLIPRLAEGLQWPRRGICGEGEVLVGRLPWWGEWRVVFKGQVSLAWVSATALRIPVLLGPFLPALPWVRKQGPSRALGVCWAAGLGCGMPARGTWYHLGLQQQGQWRGSCQGLGGQWRGSCQGRGGRGGAPGQHIAVPLHVLSSSDKEMPVGESEELASGNDASLKTLRPRNAGTYHPGAPEGLLGAPGPGCTWVGGVGIGPMAQMRK